MANGLSQVGRERPPRRLIRLVEVKRRTGMSTSTIYRWMKQGKFPRSRSIGGYIAVWSEDELDAWIGAAIDRQDADT